jgi:hypothetical protein
MTYNVSIPNQNINTNSISKGVSLVIDKLIEINGNVDKNVIPQIRQTGDEVLYKLKNVLGNKGVSFAL